MPASSSRSMSASTLASIDSAQNLSATSESSDPAPSSATTVLDLTDDALAHVLLCLTGKDILVVGCSCKRLRDISLDDSRLWQTFCNRKWAAKTECSKWVQAAKLARRSGLIFDDDMREGPDPAPRTYRSLYHLLDQMDSLVGVWRGSGDLPFGSLYQFGWAEDCVSVDQVVCQTEQINPLPRRHLFKIGPAFPSTTTSIIDVTHCVVKQYLGRFSRAPSLAAEAAASVAAGLAPFLSCGGDRHDGSTTPHGRSPVGSFGVELARFMNGFVAETRSSMKQRSRRCSSGLLGSSPPPQHSSPVLCNGAVPSAVHHFVKVKLHVPSRQHPLAGLWKGLYPSHGAEIINLNYDFTSAKARILATKITGDNCVPAGGSTYL
eukprot:gene19427-26084_t